MPYTRGRRRPPQPNARGVAVADRRRNASGRAAPALLRLLPLGLLLPALLARRVRPTAALLAAGASALVGPRLLGLAAVLGVGPARRLVSFAHLAPLAEIIA